ncbi:MAG: dTDP-4-dehydrorhamnose reductase [Candidatus Omnitrophota bacterium]|mgnify:FL=1
MEKAKKIILLLGARGMLGAALAERLNREYKVIALGHNECDVTDFKQVARIFGRWRPWLALNAAAMTNVDTCQEDPKKARAVNAKGPYNIAQSAAKYNSVVIHISTDYVFSGRKNRPYQENDHAHPVNIYGETKLEGEKLLRKTLKRHIIIRTSWLFGKGKDNFISNIIKRARKEKVLRIACDKYSSPTYTLDLARAIAKIINLINSCAYQDTSYGTYHISNSGYCSWYEYAKVILKSAKIARVKLEPVKMRQINFKARRPVFSALDNTKYLRLTGKPPRKWQTAVKDYIEHEYM